MQELHSQRCDEQNQDQARLQKLAVRPEAPQDENAPMPNPLGASANPFTTIQTQKPLVAICGRRNGYLMLATSREILTYGELPEQLFVAAKVWAEALEKLGAQRVYWLTLSEVTPHLHIHLYPRWNDDEPKGLSLFEARDQDLQPGWTPQAQAELLYWAEAFQVAVVPANS